MRRFELIAGTSSKFWQAAREGAQLRVQFGRIGTTGQEQLKSFGTEDAAQTELDRLIREKLKKGYVGVNGDGGNGSAAVASGGAVAAPAAKAKPAKSTKAPAAQPSASASPAPVQTPASSSPTPVSSGPRPPGTIAWTDAALREAAPIRGSSVVPVRAPDLRTSYAKVAKTMRELDGKFDAGLKRPNADAKRMKAARAAFAGATAPDTLDLDTQAWACAMAAGSWSSYYENESNDDFIACWLAKAGAQFALRAFVRSRTIEYEGTRDYIALIKGKADEKARWRSADYNGWRGLRIAAVLASETEHAELLAEAEEAARSGTEALRAMLAIAFERPEWSVTDPAQLATGRLPLWIWPMLAAVTTVDDAIALFDLASSNWSVGRGVVAIRYDLVARFGGDASRLLTLAVARLDSGGVEWMRTLAEALALIVAPNVAEFFTPYVGTKELGSVAATYLQTHPTVSVGPLAIAAAEKGPSAEAKRSLLRRIVVSAPGEVASIKSSLPASAQQLLSQFDEQSQKQPDAEPDELPLILRTPPWTTKRKQAPPVVLTLAAKSVTESMEWKPGELESRTRGSWSTRESADKVAHCLEMLAEARKDRPAPPIRDVSASFLARLPKKELLEVFPTLDLTRLRWAYYDVAEVLVARYGVEMIELALRIAEVDAPGAVIALLRANSARVAPLMADAFVRLKKSKATAGEWLLAFPDAAAVGLIPHAVGAPGKARFAAEQALRFLSARGHRSTIEKTAKSYGAAAEQAVQAVLDFDPLLDFPAKLPKMPPFWAAGALSRPLLAGGKKALPLSAVEALGTMLAFTKPDDPYLGIAEVKAACDPRSLADFAWDLFQTWLANGAQAKDQWAFAALGLLGDDECARRLTPMVRAWPGESAHARAVLGLDVFARIGTDVALMHLHGIAQKLKFKGLQEKAREKIDQIAEARGFTAEELADRLVPDLGLDDDGSLTLDFGARTFRVTFDESLKPAVMDDTGKRLPDLPKPKQSDDAEKAKAALDTWKALKKDAKAIAAGQVLRLEIAMCAQRRWTAEVFRRFLLEHALLVHVVRRLVWGMYDDGGKLVQGFRVAEDSSFADVRDEAVELPDHLHVGIVHRLDLDANDAAAWGQIFADYEILQPFPQLAREIVQATKKERSVQELERVAKLEVATGKVLGLDSHGWRRGAPQDGGVVCWYEKPMSGGLTAYLQLDPGIFTGAISESPQQTLGTVTLVASGQSYWSKESSLAFSELSPIAFSELLRDLDSLRR